MTRDSDRRESQEHPMSSVRMRHPAIKGLEFYAHVQAGYDLLAPTYDEDVGANPVGDRMRTVFRRRLSEDFSSGQRVLEIGCGTGTDAVWLAQSGIEVVATDISQEMVNKTATKAEGLGLKQLVHARRAAAHEIGILQREFGPEGFDGAFCHAGALNMEPELGRVPHQLRLLLRRDALFVCSAINKTSLFEIVFYLAILRPRKAFRRLDHVVPIPISRREPFRGYVVPARFYTPTQLSAIFVNEFSLVHIQGLQVLLPPSNLADVYSRLKPLFRPLERLEDWLSVRRPMNEWGHHSIITLRRR